MVFPNDSHISDEFPCKSEENILNEPTDDRKPDIVLIDADSSIYPFLRNDILNKFEESISEESNLDIISIIAVIIMLVSCEKLDQCEVRVLNELDVDYILYDFISTAVYS
ncbi:unnamed protein product [Schistosoma curassoni]|uniref:Response regulatory domain-containing protein n=1 Tax=Schistosoma curassoni TaxID=6186 RepID=A0A183L3Z3_9TREM|nr:unnamed protein product [Schistosoma curassoni]